ncbi:Cysteine-rich receptor-like protein kinase 25 [Vitis vinifera]|uniref:Cysteine-rich receptor-like protein kinase 25 n=1 Tax=Vitis vinifera TaxID=29760 RepID=A0A438HRV2_VITVI|nr:Cysteine-rich receptor-like protein kinase 25 [Vitis vinifera]
MRIFTHKVLVYAGSDHDGYEGETRTLESLQFQFSAIRVATDNFSDANKLGEGGFGSVYKAFQWARIAVKRLSAGSKQGELEFKNEEAPPVLDGARITG